MGILSPCPIAPASSAIYSFRFGSLPITRRPFMSVKIQAASTCRLRHVSRSQKGAADQPCEPNPGDDAPPEGESLRIYRESVEKFEREYSAALRALPGPKKKDMLTISEEKLFRGEAATIGEYIKEIKSTKCFLYGEGTRLAQSLCFSAERATDLASKIMGLCGSEISPAK